VWSAGRKIAATVILAALEIVTEDARSEYQQVRSRLYLLLERLKTDAFVFLSAALVAGYLVARIPAVSAAIDRRLSSATAQPGQA
jgi:hypothetical protein